MLQEEAKKKTRAHIHCKVSTYIYETIEINEPILQDSSANEISGNI